MYMLYSPLPPMPLVLSGANKYGAPCIVKKKSSVNKKISKAFPGLLRLFDIRLG